MKIYSLEERGHAHFYHFVVLQLGGLYYLKNPPAAVGIDSVIKCDKGKILSHPHDKIDNGPYTVHMDPILQFHQEAFDIIKDEYTLVNSEFVNSMSNIQIQTIYGTPLYPEYGMVCCDPNILSFLRNLFLKRINVEYDKNKMVYITRKNSEDYHLGLSRRKMINEDAFIESILKKYNITYVQLEDYTFEEKIKLFQSSSVIISPNSGALTCAIWANPNTKIIEIMKNGTKGFNHQHYYEICKCLNIPYYRYQNIKEDENGNFVLNIPDFENYLSRVVV